jgi:hypothetical protein
MGGKTRPSTLAAFISVFNCVYGVSNRCSRQWNADDADGRGLSRIKPEKISVDPLYPRHPRSMNPYTDVKTAIILNGH